MCRCNHKNSKNLSNKKSFVTKRKYFRFSKYDLKNLQNESDLFFNWYLKGTIKKNTQKSYN